MGSKSDMTEVISLIRRAHWKITERQQGRIKGQADSLRKRLWYSGEASIVQTYIDYTVMQICAEVEG